MSFIMLSVIMLSVVMLSVINAEFHIQALYAECHTVNDIMVNVIMLSVGYSQCHLC